MSPRRNSPALLQPKKWAGFSVIFLVRTTAAASPSSRMKNHEGPSASEQTLSFSSAATPAVFELGSLRRSLSDSPSPEPTRSPTAPGTFEVLEIEKPSGEGTDASFGRSVSVDGGDLLVLSDRIAYFFQRNHTGAWDFSQSIANSSFVLTSSFQEGIVRNWRALISTNAPGTFGRAVVFWEKVGGVWSFVQRVLCPELETVSPFNFGSGFDFTDDVLAVGADEAIRSASSNRGAVYVFKLESNLWVFDHKIDDLLWKNVGTQVHFSDTGMLVGTGQGLIQGSNGVAVKIQLLPAPPPVFIHELQWPIIDFRRACVPSRRAGLDC